MKKKCERIRGRKIIGGKGHGTNSAYAFPPGALPKLKPGPEPLPNPFIITGLDIEI
jgi:hypothetical protein